MRVLVLLMLGIFVLTSCGNEANNSPREKEPAQLIPPSSQNPTGRLSRRDSLSKLITEEGASMELLVQRARLNLASQNINAARADINTAQNLGAPTAGLHEVHGELYYILNQTRLAKEEWEACLKLAPKNSVCLMRLAELLIAVQNYDRALKLVNRQLEINENDEQAYFAKGIIVRDKLQDTSLALQYFQTAIDLRQNYFEAIDMMAVTLTAMNDTLAKFYFQRLLELQPNNSQTYFKMGVYYMNQSELNRAIESYTKATQLNPKDADSYYNLGYMHIELKQWAPAREYFTKAIQNLDRNYKAYYGRGFCFESVGDIANARKDYEKALEILPIYKPAAEALRRLD